MESELIPPSNVITASADIPVRAVPEAGRGIGAAERAPQELGAENRARGGEAARPVCERGGVDDTEVVVPNNPPNRS